MIDEETKAAILAEAAGGPRAKQISDGLPAYRQLGPHKKYTRAQRKKRKVARRQAKVARRRNRK